ncbi:MAG TPA: dehydrogenase, partial [Stellaceae bacterium]|nr:dehydrogenase [Stellaceae bacterium]
CLVAYLCARIPGTRVTLIDLDPARAAIAMALNVDFASPDLELPADHDLVFNASASGAGLNRALDLAGFEATVMELSWFGTASPTVALGGAFHSRRLTLKASQVGYVAPERRARRSLRERLALALSLCADPRLDVLVAAETPFDDIAARLGAILAAPETLCHLIRYPG